jgi:excisionase family DNA binding protein
MPQTHELGPRDLLTPAQAAALAGVTPRTIHRYGTDGRLTFVALPSGHRRYHRDSVEALLEPTTANTA